MLLHVSNEPLDWTNLETKLSFRCQTLLGEFTLHFESIIDFESELNNDFLTFQGGWEHDGDTAAHEPSADSGNDY